MIEFSKNLYLGADLNEKKINKYKRNIRQGRGRFDIHVISLSNNPHNQLDVFHNALFKQRLFHKLDMKIVGFAGSYDESLCVVQKILEDTMQETGGTDMKQYLLRNFKD